MLIENEGTPQKEYYADIKMSTQEIALSTMQASIVTTRRKAWKQMFKKLHFMSEESR